MGNLFKNLLDTMRLPDDEDEYDEYVSDTEEKERLKAERLSQKQALKREKKDIASRSSSSDDYSSSMSSSNATPISSATNFADARKERTTKMEKTTTANVSKVVPIRSNIRGLEVCIMKPTSFEDSQDICDMLLSGRAAVINLEGFDVEIAQRVMDFVSGAVYALGGKLHQISSYIFIISPDSVDISGDYLDLIKQNGFEVPTLSKEF